MQENLLAAGTLPKTPLEELTVLPQIPQLVGRGLEPRELHPLGPGASAFGPRP